MFFFYFFIFILYKTGTTDWFFLNYIMTVPLFTFNLEWFQITFLSIVLMLSIFLKLGSAPLHLFKIEVYDGLPYLSILFYTTFYVSVFFYFYFIFYPIYVFLYTHTSSICLYILYYLV